MTGSDKKNQLTDDIPSPQVVRERLGETLREASLLRQLLRVSMKAHEYSAHRINKANEVAHA